MKVKFNKPLEYASGFGQYYAHNALAKFIHEQNSSCFSILIRTERLRDDLWDNPDYMHQTNQLLISDLESKAREELINKYYNSDDLETLFQKYNIPKWKINYPVEDKKEQDRKFCIEVEDSFFRSQELKKYYEIFKIYEEQSKYDYNEETEEEIEVTKEQQKKNLEKIIEEAVVPKFITEHNRVYDMPVPFNHWDYRNPWQQWYFIETEDKIVYTQGGSGSSGQRENQGRFAHTFATLVKEYNQKIKTYCYVYDQENQLVFIKEFDTFKAINRELFGNYHADYEKMKELFKGLLIDSEFDKVMA